MARTCKIHWIVVVIGSVASASVAQDQSQPATQPTKTSPQTMDVVSETAFGMSPPVACLRVDGLEQFSLLPDATLTNADKLKVYFRPLRYKVETDLKNKSPYRAKFVEDGRIRRKGEKSVLAKEDKLLEYETRYVQADMQIYLVNTIGLESLAPGEYELDIILHDAIDGQATARQTLTFKVIPTATEAVVKPTTAPETPKPARTTKARTGRTARKPS